MNFASKTVVERTNPGVRQKIEIEGISEGRERGGERIECGGLGGGCIASLCQPPTPRSSFSANSYRP